MYYSRLSPKTKFSHSWHYIWNIWTHHGITYWLMVILLSRPWTRHNESLCNLSDLANLLFSCQFQHGFQHCVTIFNRWDFLHVSVCCFSPLLLIEDCASVIGFPAAAATADGVEGGFFNLKSFKSTAFRFNLMHNAEVLHDRCCKKVFYNIFRLSRIFDLFAHSAMLASHYKTNRLLKYQSGDNSTVFKNLYWTICVCRPAIGFE